MTGRTVVTIGNFDGVHLGHAALLREARRLAGDRGRVVAMMFQPHPLSVLKPGDSPAMLTPFERRAALLMSLGADDVVRLEPSREVLGLSPEEFVDRVLSEHRPSAFVEGKDFRFGRERSGDVLTLRALGQARGFEVSIIDAVEAALTDQTLVTCSSTIARWLVSRGRVADAERVLGRPHELAGAVVRGDQRGRTIGYPTANLLSECLVPADGVYAGIALLPDGRELPAAVHVGARATFDDDRRTVEAYIIGWRGPLEDGWPGASEYGWEIRVSFLAWLRDQARFDGVPALVDQIRRDVARAERAIAERSRRSAREAVNA